MVAREAASVWSGVGGSGQGGCGEGGGGSPARKVPPPNSPAAPSAARSAARLPAPERPGPASPGVARSRLDVSRSRTGVFRSRPGVSRSRPGLGPTGGGVGGGAERTSGTGGAQGTSGLLLQRESIGAGRPGTRVARAASNCVRRSRQGAGVSARNRPSTTIGTKHSVSYYASTMPMQR